MYGHDPQTTGGCRLCGLGLHPINLLLLGAKARAKWTLTYVSSGETQNNTVDVE